MFEKLWEFPLRKVSHLSFVDDGIVVSSGNKILRFDYTGLKWDKKMRVTFYRDPYGDVEITALDTSPPHIAVGTNFMDGKLYLFTIEGEKVWEQQFATTASLGWRPEDVTAVAVAEDLVAAGTEFMNEYLYVYTTKRKRVLHQQVDGKVNDLLISQNKIVAGTERRLYIFNKRRTEAEVELPVKRLSLFGERILVTNENGVYVLDASGNVERRFDAKVAFANEEYLVLEHNSVIKCLSYDLEVVWERELEKSAVNVYFSDGGILVNTGNEITLLSYDGNIESTFSFEDNVIGFNDRTVVVIDEKLKMYLYSE